MDLNQTPTEKMLFSLSFKTILEFLARSELLQIQLLNKHIYNFLIPSYFSSKKTKFKPQSKIYREANILFQDENRIFHLNMDTNLKWEKSKNFLHYFKDGEKIEHFYYEDWAKIVHLWDNKVFVSGGSIDETTTHEIQPSAFIIDTKSGLIEPLEQMNEARQCHGMVLVGQYVYCCGGFNEAVMRSCERYNLFARKWTLDVPKMSQPTFSSTIIKVEKFIYSMGGSFESPNGLQNDIENGFHVERLDIQANKIWEVLKVKSPQKVLSGCQQGVIQLKSSNPGEHKFLIFGGVGTQNSYMKQSFVFTQNIIENTTEIQNEIPIADKFYFQQNFRISKLPQEINEMLYWSPGSESPPNPPQNNCENIEVVIGREALHLYDVDEQKWIFNSDGEGYNYNDIYKSLRNKRILEYNQ